MKNEKTTKFEQENDKLLMREMTNTTNLKSLVTPWMALALVSSTIAFLYSQQQEVEDESDANALFPFHSLNSLENDNGSSSSSSAAFSTMMEIGRRFLNLSQTNINNNNNIIDTRQLEDEHFTFEEEHEPLLPLTSSDYTGFVCATLGLMVAAGGGIGGGGILVPIYILVMGFSPKHAIPLSNITVFGGAMANTYLNTQKRHPLADRPLVDWDLILIMEPLTIAGALMGAFINKVLPEELLVVLLVALLSFTAYNTLKKAMKMYRIESIALRENADGTKESELTVINRQDEVEEVEGQAEESLLANVELQDGENLGSDSLDGMDGECGRGVASGGDVQGNTIMIDVKEEALKVILEEERTPPPANVNMLIVMFIVVLIMNILKGGGAFPSPLGIKCGSTSFWIANVIILSWILLITHWARELVLKKFYAKENCGYKYVEGDIKWDERATVVYPIVCALAGFFAGMFGVGGGIVKGPLMLAMGVHPKVSSASSACMILFTSFTATTSFVVFGLLVPDYAIVCLIIGFVATYFGQILLFYFMNKYQRNSYIAFSIGGVVLLSAFLMTIQSMVSLAEGAHHKSGGICGKDS